MCVLPSAILPISKMICGLGCSTGAPTTRPGGSTRPVRHNGRPYTGMNVLLFWSEGMARGFISPIWMTFRQSAEFDTRGSRGKQIQCLSMLATLSNIQ